ncbi:MAG: hypothetical protein K9M54_13110 [Kiritimatiellales bacterium]|nr:hypothetical protein [Kiritimatiellales bacterium]MCF7863768.1 hypothetical protein [Kiritimatiellales bacterium]
MAEELRLAASHGVETVAFHIGMPWGDVSDTTSLERSDALFRSIHAVNTNAMFIPRCFLEPARFYREKYPDEFPSMQGVDTAQENHASLGSDFLFTESKKSLQTMIRHYENSGFGANIPVYYLAAQETGEWIPWLYRTGGADCGKSNSVKFRWWLERKYKTDAALQEAWGRHDATLATAPVPVDRSNRFPMKGTQAGETLRFFYQLPQEQDWVDYSAYISDITVQRIAELAAVVKEETGGRKKCLTFYGYVYELPGSMSGHLSMGDVLRNGDIDLLGAPMSYVNYSDRLCGGPGGCMSALDSLPLHGKHWISEIDTATYAQKQDAYVPAWYWDSAEKLYDIPKTPQSASAMLDRVFAFACAHRSTLWWMDLFGAGWFSDPNLWNTLDQGMGRHFVEQAGIEQAYRPEVAVIVDEKSRLYENCTWSGFFEVYPQLRNNTMLTGASTGFYYLDDFLEGRVPPAKVCLFVNLWNADQARFDRITKILKQNNSTAVWQYAPGWMRGGADGIEGATGIRVGADAGACTSRGEGLLAGLAWGPGYNIDPRICINTNGVDALAHYADGKISAAHRRQDGLDQYLLCSPGISTEVLRKIYQQAGVHLWCSPAGTINTDGKTFVHLHANTTAEYTISIPGEYASSEPQTKTVGMKKGDSLFIKLPYGK